MKDLELSIAAGPEVRESKSAWTLAFMGSERSGLWYAPGPSMGNIILFSGTGEAGVERIGLVEQKGLDSQVGRVEQR